MIKEQGSVNLIPFPASCLYESCGQQARPRLALALFFSSIWYILQWKWPPPPPGITLLLNSDHRDLDILFFSSKFAWFWHPFRVPRPPLKNTPFPLFFVFDADVVQLPMDPPGLCDWKEDTSKRQLKLVGRHQRFVWNNPSTCMLGISLGSTLITFVGRQLGAHACNYEPHRNLC